MIAALRYLSVCSGIEVGQRFGRLVVAEIFSPKRRDQFRILCRCDCGNLLETRGSRLRDGGTKSCGCYRRDRAGQLYRTHGKSQTVEYCMYYGARKRAMQQGLPFSIVPSDINIPQVCPVLGITLSQTGPRDTRPSLDRIVPARGYVVGNVHVVSFRANRIKSDATPDELDRVAAYARSA